MELAPAPPAAPLSGKLLFYLLPIRRRVVLSNLRRVYAEQLSEREIARLAQAHYAHVLRCIGEFLRFSWLSPARRREMVRVENADACIRAHAQGKGVLLLTGHFGNWEIATVGGIAGWPQYEGQFHILRRPLRPRWLDRLVHRRFLRAGLGVLPKLGALDAILDRLAAGDAVAFVYDQHAGGRDGVRADFFGDSAGTFRSLPIVALTTGAPVVPVVSWREPDGRHVLRFEEALPLLEDDDPETAIRANARAYNAVLETFVRRHPEQWFWMHRRWKV